MTKIVTNDTKKNKKHEISADNDDYYNGNYCEIYDENSNGNDHENHVDDVKEIEQPCQGHANGLIIIENYRF